VQQLLGWFRLDKKATTGAAHKLDNTPFNACFCIIVTAIVVKVEEASQPQSSNFGASGQFGNVGRNQCALQASHSKALIFFGDV
jgi:hypothetical protein